VIAMFWASTDRQTGLELSASRAPSHPSVVTFLCRANSQCRSSLTAVIINTRITFDIVRICKFIYIYIYIYTLFVINIIIVYVELAYSLETETTATGDPPH
jgi:hypothetical protein